MCRLHRWLRLGLVLWASVVLGACAKSGAGSAQTIKAGLFLPDTHSAVVWLTAKDRAGHKVAAAGTATIQVFEAEDRGGRAVEVGTPLYTFTREVRVEDYLLPDAACQPCAMAGADLIVNLGVVSFDHLDRAPNHSLGLVKVTLAPLHGSARIDQVPFGFPDGTVR